MSKKIIITVLIVLILLVLSLAGYYFITQDNPNTSNPIVSGFKSFFPFGGNDNSPGSSEETPTPSRETETNEAPLPNFTQKLRKLSIEPVSGAGTLDVKAGTIVRYIEKATGHIYEVELFSPKQVRISNTTLSIIYDAVWGNKNSSLITRSLRDDNETVDTYSITVKEVATSTEKAITAIAFPASISDISVFGLNVFYLQQNSDSSLGFVSKFDGSAKKQIWNSPIKELLSQFINDKTVALTTKPAQNVPGYLYLVDTSTGVTKKLLGGVAGLSAIVDPDGAQVFYLEQNDGAQLFAFDKKNNSSKNITPVTFPEKCIWSKNDKTIVYCAVPREFLDGTSLDLWYKGFVSYSDDIWKYDIKNNTSAIIEILTNNSEGVAIDAFKPVLSENEQYLVFMNKTDNSLWSLDLSK